MVLATPVWKISPELLGRVTGPSVKECRVLSYDMFPRPNKQLYISLLAQDAIRRAGIDLSKPFVVASDKQAGCYRFIQHEDDCK